MEEEDTFLSSFLEASMISKPDKDIKNENYRTICPANMNKKYFYKILKNGIQKCIK